MNPLPSCPAKTLLGNKCSAAGHDCGMARNVRTWEVRNVLPRQSFLRPQAVSLNMYQRVAGSLDRSADTGAACRPSCQRIGYLIWYLAPKMSSAALSYLSLEKLAAFFSTVATSLTPGQCFGRSAEFSAHEPAPGSSSFLAPFVPKTHKARPSARTCRHM